MTWWRGVPLTSRGGLKIHSDKGVSWLKNKIIIKNWKEWKLSKRIQKLLPGIIKISMKVALKKIKCVFGVGKGLHVILCAVWIKVYAARCKLSGKDHLLGLQQRLWLCRLTLLMATATLIILWTSTAWSKTWYIFLSFWNKTK
jgi:hypothetical protein